LPSEDLTTVVIHHGVFEKASGVAKLFRIRELGRPDSNDGIIDVADGRCLDTHGIQGLMNCPVLRAQGMWRLAELQSEMCNTIPVLTGMFKNAFPVAKCTGI